VSASERARDKIVPRATPPHRNGKQNLAEWNSGKKQVEGLPG
jgi:hypothetical protein